MTELESITQSSFFAGAILVVDDEESVLTMTGAILEREGFRVFIAESAAEALEVWNEHPGEIGILFTDLHMPGMRGSELAEKLLGERPSLKVIYTSGLGKPMDPNGRSSFIAKPYRPEALMVTIRRALSKGQTH